MSRPPTSGDRRRLKIGDRIQILEAGYCGIVFARVGDSATVTHLGPIASGFWVQFDVWPDTPCMLLSEHTGVGWQPLLIKECA